MRAAIALRHPTDDGDLRERLRTHRLGLGSKGIDDHAAPRLVGTESFADLTAAVRRERQRKRWSRAKKTALVRGASAVRHELSRSRD